MKKPPVALASRAPAAESPGTELWLLMVELAFSLRGWWIEICYGLDLTPVQGLALRMLNPDVPLAMSALADTLTCDASNITGVVDKLEARGLIARQADGNDRRVKVLVVTEKGRDLRARLLARSAETPPEIEALPKAVREQMTGALRSLLAQPRPRELPIPSTAARR